MVYDDAEKLYAEVKSTGEALLEEALSVLFPSSAPLVPSPVTNAKLHARILSASTKLVAFNTTFFPRVEVVKVPLSKMTKEVKSMVLQASEDGRDGYAVVACAEGAAVGEVVSPSNRLRSKLMPVSVYTNGSDHFVMRNSSVQLTIADGRITSLLDVKTDRELISKGQTGGLVIFQDRPNYWDAWDVEIHHLEVSEQLKFENVSVVSQGPVFGTVRAEVKYGKSTIVLTVSVRLR
jgi:alpha-mannosidase